jgi:3-dehydroquinate dehydratase/shikimate dehydrogenase
MRKKLALPKICIAVTGETPEQLLESARSALKHSQFIELRLDWLKRPQDGVSVVTTLFKETRKGRREGAILQVTCRRKPNGGLFEGSVREQMGILEAAIDEGCRVVDVEIETAEQIGHVSLESLRANTALILSWHDFHGTPSLDSVGRRLQRFNADYYKAIPTATKQSDNCTAIEFLSESTKGRDKRNWIVFAMEQSGIPSRVLALSRGSSFVYASCPSPEGASAQAGSAPGQVDAESLMKVFRADKLNLKTAIYGLLGSPIGHSIGAALHNAGFQTRKLNAVFLPLLATDLKDFRKAAERYPLAGFSVTIPHKRSIVQALDSVDPIVKLAGAANTVRIRRGRWEAINSDVEGIIFPLRKKLRLAQDQSLGKTFRAVVVGTGGAARAAVVALRELKCGQIEVAGRDYTKVEGIARQLGARTLDMKRLQKESFDLMIHSTSVGMWPHTEDCLLKAEEINAGLVFDLVYNPAETTFLKRAAERGSDTISGLEMFLAQAARQFEFWTGVDAPRQLFRRVAEEQLRRYLPLS